MTDHERQLAEIRETLQMAAAQTVENAKRGAETDKRLDRMAKEFDREMKATREEHNREMRDLRKLLRKVLV